MCVDLYGGVAGEFEIAGLSHFVCHWLTVGQYTMPVYPAAYEVKEQRKQYVLCFLHHCQRTDVSQPALFVMM
jgi:hypothetical protein